MATVWTILIIIIGIAFALGACVALYMLISY